jgi:glycosyltransferase involved in cell wall biosynthesis
MEEMRVTLCLRRYASRLWRGLHFRRHEREATREEVDGQVDEQTELLSEAPKLRILLVTARYVPDIGGTELHTKELADRLAAAGHNVTVLTTDLTGRYPAVELDARTGLVIQRVRAWPAKRDFYLAPGIYSTIRRGSWDVVHCQGYHTFVAPLAMLAAQRSHIPYIVSFHSGGHSSRFRRSLRRLHHWTLRPLLRRACWLVAGSRSEAEFFQKRLGFASNVFRIIAVHAALPVVPRVEPDRRHPLILSVGRLEQYKGHHKVIEALPLVADREPGVTLRVVGDGPYEPQLRRLVDKLGVKGSVEIKAVPATQREEMAQLLSQASLVVSLSDFESAGLAIREAVLLGRRVLVTETPAFADLLQSPLVGQIPSHSSREQIAAAIVGHLQQPDGNGARLVADWDACVSAYETLYHFAVRGR